MRKSRLIQHYNDKQASFHLYFKRTFERQGIEDIHKLRLNIKKLRATLSLMELASHGMLNKKRYFALFSKLFDEAGEVWEAQVSLGMIEKSNAIYLMKKSGALKRLDFFEAHPAAPRKIQSKRRDMTFSDSQHNSGHT